MTEPLQKRDWRESNYQRPQDKWVCGMLCDGNPCAMGPTSKGQCTKQTQCHPEKRGDRFFCTRLPIHGGVCEQGPGPDGSCCQVDVSCQPRLSLSSIRRRISLVAAAVALGYALYLTGASEPLSMMSPGKVIAGHANFESNCSACHASGDGGLDQWLANSIDPGLAISDSERCLKCHSDLSQETFSPHNMATEQLTQLTMHAENQAENLGSFTDLLSRRSSDDPHELACAVCHREHHGRLFDLKQLSDQQCQTCHANTFHSFEKGHPAFENYPYERRSRIYFDHATHLLQYFKDDSFKRVMPDGESLQQCNSCHVVDEAGNRMLTASFEKTCASCHESQIVDSDFPGIPMFALPRIDVSNAVMPDGNVDGLALQLGEWPYQRGAMVVTHMPPFMELLLASRSTESKSSQPDGIVFDFRQTNMTEANSHQLVQDLVWDIKELLFDLMQAPLASSGSDHTTQAEQAVKYRPSIVPSLKQAAALWFPNLEDEVKAHRAGGELPDVSKSNVEPNAKLKANIDSPGTGWYISQEDFSIRYRPNGHTDPLLKGLLEQIVSKWNDVSTTSDATSDASRRLFRWLGNPSASGTDWSGGPMSSGRCLSCHAVDKNVVTGKYAIQWQAGPLPGNQRELTQFSHKAHVVSSQSENCKSCHQIDATTDSQSFFRNEFFKRDKQSNQLTPNFDSKATCTSGFLPISRAQCATCHKKSAANQSCLTCHRYHGHKLSGDSSVD